MLTKCTLKSKHIQENSTVFTQDFLNLYNMIYAVSSFPTVSIAAASIHCLIPCHPGLLKAYGLINIRS